MSSKSWQLVLYPEDPSWSPAGDLVTDMQTLGLLGKAWSAQQGCYLIGERFLQYVTFMGCAPAVQFEPPAAGEPTADFIHWHISNCTQQAKWYVDTQQGRPGCPGCRARISDWQSRVPDVSNMTPLTKLQCPNCGASHEVVKLDWRHSAGYARIFLAIVNIYPKEALPTDAMLQELSARTAVTWKYFYYYGERITN